ncbi:MAG: hypothetical protein GWN07_02005, partial [Actinobacteria bacterium]|nr:hypothetical protein [Actinomycetota bacterium]NIW26109.1 hypothetical protein [Actinomycetota bacterium]NIX18679.1 hypothetical protein [Actinomycetota bacterium]
MATDLALAAVGALWHSVSVRRSFTVGGVLWTLAFAFVVVGCDELASDGPDGSFDRDAGPIDAAPAVDAQPPEDLDGFVEWQMDAGGLPGVAAGLVVDGEIAFVGTWGYADV